MAQETEHKAETKQNDVEKIELTKEELDNAEKIMMERIKYENRRANSFAAAAGVFDAIRQISNRFSSVNPAALIGSFMADFLSKNASNWSDYENVYLGEKVGYKAETWLHKEFEKRPQMERRSRNPAKLQSYLRNMYNYTGNFLRQKSFLWAASASTLAGLGIAAGSVLSSAAISAAAITTAAVSCVTAGAAQYLLGRNLKEKKVENKGAIEDERKKEEAYSYEMLANSNMRDHTSSQEHSHKVLEKKQEETLSHSKIFISTLRKFSGYFSGLQLAATVATCGAGIATGLEMQPLVLLTGGVLTITGGTDRWFSAYFGTKEYIKSFALSYHKFRRGFKDFYYGPEKVKENSNVIEIDKIKYKFRDTNGENKTFGEKTDIEAFNTAENIRIGPGVNVLTGCSGAGKSTLISLMCHGDYVTDGAIRIGQCDENGHFTGQNYKDLGCFEVADQIAYGCSTPHRDDCSVEEYIRIGNPQISDKELQKVIKLLGIETADDEGKPKMLPVISNGQLSRVSLAQAIISPKPIIILDEPTSGVDGGNSKGIIDYLKKLGDEGKTVLFTTHNKEDIQPWMVQGIDIDDKYSQDGTSKGIKTWNFRALGSYSSFMEVQNNRKSPEEEAKEKKKQEEQQTKEIINDRKQAVWQKIKGRMHEEKIESIPKNLLIEYKKDAKDIPGGVAAKQATDLFNKIGRGAGPKEA